MSFVDRFLTRFQPNVPNELVAADPAFGARCAESHRLYAARVEEWRRAIGDEPEFTTDPVECRYALARTCAWVCGVLVEPHWSRRDVNLLAEHLPTALACPEFRDLVAGHLTRLVLAIRAGRAVTAEHPSLV